MQFELSDGLRQLLMCTVDELAQQLQRLVDRDNAWPIHGLGITLLEEGLPSEWAIYSDGGEYRGFTGDGSIVEVTLSTLPCSEAYLDGKSYGGSVSISVIVDGSVVAAFVRDIFGGSLYYTFPGVEPIGSVYRQEQDESITRLEYDVESPLETAVLAINRRPASGESAMFDSFVYPSCGFEAFGRVDRDDAISLPLFFMRLLDGSAGACLFEVRPGNVIPVSKLDIAPVLLLLELAGFVWLTPSADGARLEEIALQVSDRIGEAVRFGAPCLVVHQSKVQSVKLAFERVAVGRS